MLAAMIGTPVHSRPECLKEKVRSRFTWGKGERDGRKGGRKEVMVRVRMRTKKTG
jgi:hypothetical protein